MYKNSDRFLEAFNAIEKHLRRTTKSDPSVHFYELIGRASKTDATVRGLRIDLQEYADLRNAIVHERTDGHVLAEPNELAVQKIEQMMTLITKPPVLRTFMTPKVDIFQANQSISEVVNDLFNKNFSQAPVYDEKIFIGLLTTNTIARWLGANVAEDIFSLKETSIRRVLEYTEDPKHVIFLSPEKTVFEVLEIHQKRVVEGRHLEAILVTHSGKSTENLMGMLTVWDFPKLYQAIEVSGR